MRLPAFSLAPASADASFRRYFRATVTEPWRNAGGAQSLIVMDAPPAREDCRPFVHVARLLVDAGVHAPKVLAADIDRGYLLLTDLGTTTYAAALDAQSEAWLRERWGTLSHGCPKEVGFMAANPFGPGFVFLEKVIEGSH